MKPVIGKTLAAIGWLLGFLFIALVAIAAMPRRYGSPVMALFFGMPISYVIEFLWLRLAWKTMTLWFKKPVATAAISLLVPVYAAILYVGWVGVQS